VSNTARSAAKETPPAGRRRTMLHLLAQIGDDTRV